MPYRVMSGTSANRMPAARPACGETMRRPSAATKPAATAMAMADGSRSASSPEPNIRTIAQARK